MPSTFEKLMFLPDKCLSVRQPWAWALIYAGKTLENRAWGGWNNHQKKFRGKFCVHASSGMTRGEYEDAKAFMKHMVGIDCPAPVDLVRGGIIGTARVTGWVTHSQNPWFMGPGALVIEDAVPLAAPIPCGGALGWFEVKQIAADFAPVAKWMMPKGEPADPVFQIQDKRQETLF